MALPTGRQAREYNKFVADAAGNTAIRVVATDASGADALKVEDTAHVSGDTGTPVLAVRNDAGTALAGTTGDYIPLTTDNSGKLWVNTGLTVDTSTLALESGGNLDTVAGDTTSIDGKTPALGNAAMAASVPVTLASDDTLATAIKTAVETLDNAISGSEMQVDVVAALPAGTNAIGKLVANSGVDIGDVDVTSTSIDKSINGAGAPTIDSYTHVAISAAANTANQSLVAAPGANKQIWIYGVAFTVGTGDGSASFQDEDDTAISGVMPFAQNGGMVVAPSGNFAMPLWKVATNKALEVDTVTCDIEGFLDYAIVSV